MRMKGTTVKAGMVALLLCLAMISASCGSDKSADTAEIGVEQREASTEHPISSDNLEVVQWLFEKNGLDLKRYQVKSFGMYPEYAQNPQATYYGIRAGQVYKGLPIFLDDVGYGFNKNGDLVYRADRRLIYNMGTEFSEKPRISVDDAAQKAVDAHPGSFAGNKLITELGFHNKHVGMSSEPDYVLAWRITTGGEWPFAIVDATNGEVLYYDDGIRY